MGRDGSMGTKLQLRGISSGVLLQRRVTIVKSKTLEDRTLNILSPKK
jgi:hypothetical protein